MIWLQAMSSCWSTLNDEQILDLRLCDLGLTLEQSGLKPCIEQLYQELAKKGIVFRPLCYLADEWFVPTGDTVIGIPFYLAHPRLRDLEKKMISEVEGGTPEWCMKLLRHEAGHALYYAYGLRRKKKLHQIFGPPSEETPKIYSPQPDSKNFVRHLEGWYAQSDPDEDFAETFAVWLNPDNIWQEQYQGWQALEKLEYMDHLMKSLIAKPPLKTTVERPYATITSRMKLKTYYQRKQKEYAA
jgi:hypothetical protein